MLWAVILIQIMLGFDNHARGINIIVGTIIFSIVIDLDFVHSRCHMYWRLLLVEINLGLLHRLRIRGE